MLLIRKYNVFRQVSECFWGGGLQQERPISQVFQHGRFLRAEEGEKFQNFIYFFNRVSKVHQTVCHLRRVFVFLKKKSTLKDSNCTFKKQEEFRYEVVLLLKVKLRYVQVQLMTVYFMSKRL